MAALRKDAPTKSFFSSPSNTFKKLVNAFPKPQKHSVHSHHSSPLLQPGSRYDQQQLQPELAEECEEEEGVEDEIDVAEFDGYEAEPAQIPTSSAAEDDGGDADNGVDDEPEYSSSSSSSSEYSRPRIHQDLLPHDFSAWQKSPSIASSTSREAESFFEVLSSSTSQDRYAPQGGETSHARNLQSKGLRNHRFYPNCMESHRNPSPNERPQSPNPTVASATASSPLVDLHLHKMRQKLPDLKLDVVAHGSSGLRKYCCPAGLKGLPEDCWSVRSGASVECRRNSVDGSCWQNRKVHDPVVTGSLVRELMQEGGTLHENLVDMMPFIDTYREHQEDGYQRNNFQHHASMVYTRAPSREALVKKVSDTANARRLSRNSRKVKKASEAMWEEEQENQPRRARGPDLSCSPRRVFYENAVDIAKLQGQVEALQRKLSITEGVLQSYHCLREPKHEGSEVQTLMEKVEELQRKIVQKDQLLDSAQETLTLKENEIRAMHRHLRDSEETCTGLRARRNNMEEELTALRCEVAALRWQSEVDAERARIEIKLSKEDKDHCVNKEQEEECEVGKMEAVRKMYLAVLIVAKLVPMEECLVLVRILRAELQCLARIPAVSLS
ncbi:hypothetical protein GOP47_0021636 [Adiantum capillus-veneris]|uniref:Uncharacterized protein n=1 Tax=Adiantum capillus-veneris TaxID=13818 RepID=A0A9D4U9M6_ADICA|nr:hypothetical protein GOP47_0021636 [Adiantum capillus-veneris]